MVDSWDIPVALDGERIDRTLSLLTGLSRREVNQLLEEAKVTIGNRAVVSRSRKVRTGERVAVENSPVTRLPAVPAADLSVAVPVVWFDDDVIVIDKPAGLVVHPGAGNQTGTLVQGLLARFPDLIGLVDPPDIWRGTQADRPGIVHRLDKGTSGLLVVARTRAARAGLVAQLSRRDVERQYTALAAGTVEADAGLIDAPLGRADRDPTRVRVQAGGRPARTRYQVDERYDLPVPTTLLRCRLETGRTHQIRVHLASIGHPVVGDDRYRGQGPVTWRPLEPGRLFLHAAGLGFAHPRTGEPLTFSSPLPEDLAAVLLDLGQAGNR